MRTSRKFIRKSWQSSGFALPTVLIASIIMLGVLMVSISSVAAIRSGLATQYYNQLAQNASDAGVAYARACLDASGGIPKWSNASPLTPSTDCKGVQLPTVNCPADAACYVTSTGNLRSTFSVGLSDSDKDKSGRLTNIRSIGMTNLIKTSDGTTWRTFKQNSVYKFNYSTYLDDGLVFNLDAGNSDSFDLANCPTPASTVEWIDLTGKGYNSALKNGVGCTTANGGAFTFDGSNDYIQIGSLGAFFYDTATVNIWFKTGSSIGNERALFATKYNGGYKGVRIYTDSSNRIDVHFGDEGGSSIGLVGATGPLTTNTWYNFTLVWDKYNWKYSCYLNGEPGISNGQPVVLQDNALWPSTLPDLVIGTGRGTTSGYFWNGSISIVQFYDRVLSGAEVRQNYQRFAGRYN